MTKLRILAIAILFAAPFLFLMGAGSYHLWESGWLFAAWWPMALCLTVAYGLLWYWTRRRSKTLLPDTGHEEPPDPVSPDPRGRRLRDRDRPVGLHAVGRHSVLVHRRRRVSHLEPPSSRSSPP